MVDKSRPLQSLSPLRHLCQSDVEAFLPSREGAPGRLKAFQPPFLSFFERCARVQEGGCCREPDRLLVLFSIACRLICFPTDGVSRPRPFQQADPFPPLDHGCRLSFPTERSVGCDLPFSGPLSPPPCHCFPVQATRHFCVNWTSLPADPLLRACLARISLDALVCSGPEAPRPPDTAQKTNPQDPLGLCARCFPFPQSNPPGMTGCFPPQKAPPIVSPSNDPLPHAVVRIPGCLPFCLWLLSFRIRTHRGLFGLDHLAPFTSHSKNSERL